MSDNRYKMQSTSLTSSKMEDVELSESENGLTRKILRAKIVENSKAHENTVEVAIVHQRRGSGSDPWKDLDGRFLSELKAGESAKLTLDTAQTKSLFEHLGNLYKIGEKGVRLGTTILEITNEDEVIKTDSGRTRIIKKLLEGNYTQEFWDMLLEIDPKLATRLSFSAFQQQRVEGLKEFEENISKNNDEDYWQHFFERNTWIFGYGLDYKILKTTQSQPNYGGAQVTNRGGQRGDYLTHSQANTKFTVLVEIKKPQTTLLGTSEYRNGAWELGKELVGGIAQLQSDCRTWDTEGSRTEGNRELMSGKQIFTMEPKGILVIGNSNQLDANKKRTTFELFRRNIHNPEILTFDELLERARFIVNQS